MRASIAVASEIRHSSLAASLVALAQTAVGAGDAPTAARLTAIADRARADRCFEPPEADARDSVVAAVVDELGQDTLDATFAEAATFDLDTVVPYVDSAIARWFDTDGDEESSGTGIEPERGG